MATITSIDRRESYYAESKPRALDRLMDITAAADESRRHLERAHEAHCTNDWPRYLSAVDRINRGLVQIRSISREWAGFVEESPAIPSDQLILWSMPQAA